MKRLITLAIVLMALSAAGTARADDIQLASVDRNRLGATGFSARIGLIQRDANYYYNRGNAFLRLKQYDRAIAEYSLALRMDPTDVDAFIARAAAYYYTAAYAKALRDWGAVIRLNPKSAAAYGNRAWTYCQLGRADRGLDDARRALQLKVYGDGYAARACNYGVSGDIPAAIRDYEKALSLSPDHGEAADWRRAIDRLRRKK